MPDIWFTADFHLGHKNIIRYCNRPFETVEEMNQAILERLNALRFPEIMTKTPGNSRRNSPG